MLYSYNPICNYKPEENRTGLIYADVAQKQEAQSIIPLPDSREKTKYAEIVHQDSTPQEEQIYLNTMITRSNNAL